MCTMRIGEGRWPAFVAVMAASAPSRSDAGFIVTIAVVTVGPRYRAVKGPTFTGGRVALRTSATAHHDEVNKIGSGSEAGIVVAVDSYIVTIGTR
jgi:hypothetical protein